VDELCAALTGIAGPHEILAIEGAGHDLGSKGALARVAETVAAGFQRFVTDLE
jgi:predicted alpha/beta-hydrolase family hydrolase